MGFAVEQRHEACCLELLLNRVFHACQLEYRWSDLNGFHGVSDALCSQARVLRRFQKERDTHGRIVDEEAVFFFAVLSKGFAVIAEEDDQGIVIEAVGGLLEPGEEPSQLAVRVGDFALIGLLRVLRAERFGRVIRTVRVVEMEPEEKRLIWMSFKPANGVVHALFRAALDEAEILYKELLPGKCVIVAFKSAGEPPTPNQYKRADDRAGSIDVVFEAFSQSAQAIA